MFNKKLKRSFRQRKCESSEEDEHKINNDEQEKASGTRFHLAQSRGLSCSSRREALACKSDSSGTEDVHDMEEDTAGGKGFQRVFKKEIPKKTNVLSFSDEKEVDQCDFKVKRAAEKAVVFKARKKENSPDKKSSPKGKKVSDITKASSEEQSGSGEEMHPGSDGDTSSQTSSLSSTSIPKPDAIPDPQKIRAAKRQQRKAKAQKEYIPLERFCESPPMSGEEEGVGAREEESDSEVDDHQRRIQFAPKPKTLRQRIAEKLGGSDSEESCSDSQEEHDQNLWEEQQIGKGVKRHQHQSRVYPQATVKVKKPFDIPESLPPVSIDVIKKRITGKLESLREVHRAREAEMRRITLDIDSAKASLEQLESGSTDEQHKFYRAMRVYVQNLVECLSEKMVLINSVELEVHTLLIDQAEALLSRRREAVRKESSHLQQLAYGTSPPSIEDAEKSSVEALEERQAFDLERGSADEEPQLAEEAELARKRADILRSLQDIFVDVQEDFSDVKRILTKFDEWRVLFPESYYNAYISLCLPKLLGPLIRHQLVGWNPLKAESEDFESLPWYSAVEKFCYGQGHMESENPDRELLPSIIQKTILPKIQGFVELVWDPLSAGQSHCLANLCRRLQQDYATFDGEPSKPVKAFVEAVTAQLRTAVDEDVFIPLYPKKFLDDASSPQFRFRDRQFWSAVKLLGNITLWDGLIPEDVLKELALEKLLNRYIMMTLLNTTERESVEKSKKVAACFPKSWFNVSTRSSIPQLKNFSSHLLQTTHSLCKSNSGDTSIRDVVADVLILLGNIKALDNVATIAEKYHYEDLRDSLNLA